MLYNASYATRWHDPYLPVASFGEVHTILMEAPEDRSLQHRTTFHRSRR